MHGKGFFCSQLDVNCSTGGDNIIVPGKSDKRIYVWKFWLIANGAVNVKFKDGTTDLNGFAIPLVAQGSNLTFAFDNEPYWKAAQGDDFILNLSSGVQVTGRIYFTYEP